MTRPLILLTNDDGIHSRGLAAAAAALDPLGDLLIVAPRTQQTSMGRSMPAYYDGRLFKTTLHYGGQSWEAYAANASPAQAVVHAMLELAQRPIALAVSGINYGENVGLGITVSGTVGAAIEAAAQGIPAIAVSLQVTDARHFTEPDDTVDFSAAIHFTRLFAQRWLSVERPPGVDVLKVEVPAHATPQTPWRVTRLERRPYFVPLPPRRTALEDEGPLGYRVNPPPDADPETDAGALKAGFVAVTPLCIDMTARIPPHELRRLLDGKAE